MEYRALAKMLNEHPWLWAIVPIWPNPNQLEISVRRATESTPLQERKPEGSEIWFVLGASMTMRKPRVFEVRKIDLDDRRTIRVQLRDGRWGLEILYIVAAKTPPYPGTFDITIFKRPLLLDDFRSLIY